MVFKNGFWSADDPFLKELYKIKNKEGVSMDWLKEEKELKESDEEWFRPKQGMSQLVFLDEGTLVKGKDFQGKEVDKVRFLVSVDKKTLAWEVIKVKKKSSLYGQIVRFATLHEKLTGQLVLLNVVGEKKDTRYSLIDPSAVMGQGGRQ